MTENLTRRDFLKIAAVGTATAAALSGCGTAAKYVKRQPYTEMPEYLLPGQSVYYATTCRECPAGCGIIVRNVEGRAKKIEGNPNHPLNQGATCARGQAALEGLYNPDRIEGTQQQSPRGSGNFQAIGWDKAIEAVSGVFANTPADEIAFLLGLAPDHLLALVSEIANTIGAPAPVRFGAQSMFDGRKTLVEAAEALFGAAMSPHFDIANTEVIFSFGANFMETWLSPVAFSRGFGQMRQGTPGKRGYFVQFEPRMSQTGAVADEWIPVAPGTEGLVAQAIGKLVAELRGTPAAFFSGVDVSAVAAASSVPEETLQRLARIFFNATRKVALPGGAAIAHTNGLQAAQAVLALDAVAGAVGAAGGIFFSEGFAGGDSDIRGLIERMNAGQVKALFIHGVNPLFELPPALGFQAALAKVEKVISFASYPDETAMQADFVLPDHTSLESWGAQVAAAGGDRFIISASQPVVIPFYDTKATADVLLAALPAGTLNYSSEVDYLQKNVPSLIELTGSISAEDARAYWAQWLQHGGWWQPGPSLETPSSVNENAIGAETAQFGGEGELTLLPYPHPLLGDGSLANRPWLQETPDPTTTVMWYPWVEINPEKAKELGVKDDDVVKISSPAGEIEAVVYLYPAIRPDVVAMPFGQGHTALGRYAEGRGSNPLALVTAQFNAAGDLAFAATKVKITPTGKTRKLARRESWAGVYGEGRG